ncbi:MAG: alpha/beta hydrolase [Anaerolineae bacterium]|nr:alpha/beta hydrolase [Anaerolineae bacterium]MBT7190883.1 alpha/beta hydrolase [Anaerolineae bacterium]MBT7991869.1 alpha/beta hydrolase [Anaerolineae bacterium]
MNIYFSHGKLSSPTSQKLLRLTKVAERRKHTTHIIDFTDTLNPDLRAERLSAIIKKDTDEKILVGSSMGGYTSLVAAGTLAIKGLFILAPALYLSGYRTQNFSPKAEEITIIHGWNDETVPIENSIRFAKKHCATLHILNSDHRLYSVLGEVEQLFAQFLQNLTKG